MIQFQTGDSYFKDTGFNIFCNLFLNSTTVLVIAWQGSTYKGMQVLSFTSNQKLLAHLGKFKNKPKTMEYITW
jgi:hypothetical protein